MIESKKCSSCKILKLITEFAKNKSRKDGFNGQCKDCMSKGFKKYYEKNKEKHIKQCTENNKIKNNKKQIEINKNKDYIIKFISKNGCFYCGEKDINCLDFYGQNITINEISKNIFNQKLLIGDEIKKYKILCINCYCKQNKGIL